MTISHSHPGLTPICPTARDVTAKRIREGEEAVAAIAQDAAISAETRRLERKWFLEIAKLRQACDWDEANIAERIWQEFYSACQAWKDRSQASSRVRETA